MADSANRNDRSAWAVGGTTLIGLGIGMIFIRTDILVFIASLLAGIGAGLLIASLLPGKQG